MLRAQAGGAVRRARVAAVQAVDGRGRRAAAAPLVEGAGGSRRLAERGGAAQQSGGGASVVEVLSLDEVQVAFRVLAQRRALRGDAARHEGGVGGAEVRPQRGAHAAQARDGRGGGHGTRAAHTHDGRGRAALAVDNADCRPRVFLRVERAGAGAPGRARPAHSLGRGAGDVVKGGRRRARGRSVRGSCGGIRGGKRLHPRERSVEGAAPRGDVWRGHEQAGAGEKARGVLINGGGGRYDPKMEKESRSLAEGTLTRHFSITTKIRTIFFSVLFSSRPHLERPLERLAGAGLGKVVCTEACGRVRGIVRRSAHRGNPRCQVGLKGVLWPGKGIFNVSSRKLAINNRYIPSRLIPSQWI